MAGTDKNFVVKTGLEVGSTVITASTGSISTSGNITVGNTIINGTSGTVTVGNTTINGTTGNITTSGGLSVASLLVGGAPVGSSAVAAITSGSINGATIGASVPAAANFSTVGASGVVTVNSDIMPAANNVSNIGSATNRFSTIFVNEARLSTNTLYLGDTAILGTSNNVVTIHADPGQAISMLTSGASGTMSFVANAQMTHQTTGNNADILIQSNGTGSQTRILSAASVDITAPTINIAGSVVTTGNTATTGDVIINGNVTITGNQSAVNADNLTVKDNIVIVNSGETGVGVTSGLAGIQFARGQVSSYQLVFKEADQTLQFGPVGATNTVAVKNGSGQVVADLLGNVTGNVNGSATTAATVTSAAQPAITSVGTLTGLTVTAPISGSVTGTAGSATTAGSASTAATVTSAAQPAITSVGTLTALTVTGNVTAANFIGTIAGGLVGNVTGNVSGSAATVTSAAQPAITSVGTLTGLTVTSPIVGNVSGSAATVTSAAQPAITSVGTLTSLTTSGNVTVGKDLTVQGNLVIQGNSTTLSTTVLDVSDVHIELAYGAVSAAAADTGGIHLNGAGANIVYDYASDSWNSNKLFKAPNFAGTLTGNVIGNASTATTAGAASTATSATTAGTVTTAAQPAITSVGTLSTLNVAGTLTAGTFTGYLNGNAATASIASTANALNTLNSYQASGLSLGAAKNAGWAGNISVVEIGSVGSINDFAGMNPIPAIAYGLNVYRDATSWRAKETGKGALYIQRQDGSVTWYQIPSTSGGSTVTLVNAMSLDNTGNLTVGNIASTSFSGSFVGSGAGLTSVPNTALTNSSITVTAGTGMSGGGAVSLGGTVTLNNAGVTQLSGGGGITASGSTGAITLGSTATSANTASAIVARDGSGNFTAGTITAALTGTASKATNIAGGAAWNVHYQSAADTTSFVSAGTTGQVLTATTGGAPTWAAAVSSLTVGTGSAYMSVSGTTGAITITNNATTANVASTIVARDAAGAISVGAITGTTFSGTSTAAKYADLAENYVSDFDYAPGTVVEFGGKEEITEASDGSRAVAGVVSTDPAYLMNAGLDGVALPIALQGRVPVKVVGKVSKGDMMISAGKGFARAEAEPKLGQVIGKALESFDGKEGVIEVVVGRM